MNIYERERYSVCIVHADNYGEKSYYKYFRVADFFPGDNPDELVPAIVQQHVRSLEGAQENPDHLYNPSAAYNHDKRDSDFFLFQWWLDPSEPGKQLTRSFYDDLSILDFPEPKEVFVLDGDNGERSLRSALTDGIPFDGKTTSVFYIAYGNDKGRRPAIRCERRDFSFDGGLIKLRHEIANVKETALSAPRVWLKDIDIIDSPHLLTGCRKVYAKLGELEVDGNVLLRPLEYYASDYVKWFIREESIQATRADRRAISQLIDAAFLRPDALETYLDADAQEEEVHRLRESIARIVMEKEDPDRELIQKALLEDEGFYRECIERVMQSSDALLEERKMELASAKREEEKSRSSLTKLQSDIKELEQRKANLEADIKVASDESKRIVNEQEKVLEEVQSNIALKLGLRTAAAQSCSPFSSTGLLVVEGLPAEAESVDGSFEEALLNNLKRLGVTTVVGRPDEERKSFVRGLICGLAATKFIAVPQAVARQVADSLSIAISNRGARRVCVPPDFRDVAAVAASADPNDAVVLFEGIIDAVNEGALFALLGENPNPIIILSFASHASASLVAKEAWGKVFLANAESLLTYCAPVKPSKMKCVSKLPDIPKDWIDDALTGARELNDDLNSLNLPAGPLLLASIVLHAVEDLTDEDGIERYVSQHLLISSRSDAEAYAIVEKWSEEDNGLAELAKKLDIYGS